MPKDSTFQPIFPNENDRKNFAYDSKRAVQIVEQYRAEWKYLRPDCVESQIGEAKAKVGGGFEAYAERLASGNDPDVRG